jgi:starch synthase
VTLVLPKYAGVTVESAPVDRFTVFLGSRGEEAACYEVPLAPNARAVLVEHTGFFDRQHLYGEGHDDYPDNPRRFAFLSRAALEFASREGERVDVVFAHDWQTGLVPVFLRTAYAETAALAGAVGVFAVHHVAFQGLCSPHWLDALGLSRELFSVDGLEFWGKVSFLKGGVNFADVVVTSSEHLAAALHTPGGGAGFEGVVAARGDAFRGAIDLDGMSGAERLTALFEEAVAERRAQPQRVARTS